MFKGSTVKQVGIVMVGVILSGFILHQLRGNGIADQARGGFN